MKIENLFERDIYRPINGVVKADQLDDASVWQELDEFVVTRELDQHLRIFFSTYVDSVVHPNHPDVGGKIGIWVSGFFGSGKSHFIKVLSYILQNRTHHYDGAGKQAIDFFENKIQDATVFGDIKRSVAESTDVILFNIDSKADHRAGRDAILQVFLKVFNEMQGYSGDHPHVAHMERYLDSKDKLTDFHEAYRNATGSDWIDERDAYLFNRDVIVTALHHTLNISPGSAGKWIDGAEEGFALTIENLARWIKHYLDKKGGNHRIVFLVDEVGQFIAGDTHLMLNLQTIAEELGTICKGRAWIIVTAQEDIDAVLGEMKKSKAQDFSKIQGRFKTRLSLSSANVDEVIQSRLLAKRSDVVDELKQLFNEKGDIIKHQLTFTQCGMTLKNYKSPDEFVINYPFAPYQFQLLQKIFEAIRGAGATGLHLSRGERSILDAFQSAGKQVGLMDVGVLVPLYRFYPSIESFLDTVVKRTIDQAKDNPSLEPFDIQLLQVLFLIRYVDEMKGTVDNLVTLCIDQIDADKLALRRRIEESLHRLEKETLINRNGDIYFFLTNEERDINKEIKLVDLTGNEESRLLGEILFTDVLKDGKKYRYPENKQDYNFNRLCDLIPIGVRFENAMQVFVFSPLFDEYDLYDNARCALDSTAEDGCVLIRLGRDDMLGRELVAHIQTDKYTRYKNDGTLPETTKRILRDRIAENTERRNRLVKLIAELFTEADVFVNGQKLTSKSSTSSVLLDEALEYLLKNTFTKRSFLKHIRSEALKELQAILRINDIGQQTLSMNMDESNPLAIEEIRTYVELCTRTHRQIVLHEMLEKRFMLRPYGWPENDTLLLIARLMVLGELNLMMDGKVIPPDKAFEPMTTAAKRRKITILRRMKTDEADIQKARALGKELFQEMGPDGEDALFAFYQTKLKNWRDELNRFKPLADTGNYPGRSDIDEGLTLVNRLLIFDQTFPFFEKIGAAKKELQECADRFQDLHQFYTQQRTSWEHLKKSYGRFSLNRLSLEADEHAGPALKRMHDILNAPEPYGLIKEADGLIVKVNTINSKLVQTRRQSAIRIIKDRMETITSDVASAHGTDAFLNQSLNPLERLLKQIESEDSIAHITQLESEAVRAFERVLEGIDKYVQVCEEKKAQKQIEQPMKPVEAYRKRRTVHLSNLRTKTYLETMEDVDLFVDALKRQLNEAIERNERIKIEE